MFIKKDGRKIYEILEDEKDERHVLKLSKRTAEFNGKIDVLRISTFRTSALANLKVLNLYDNHIKSLEGIGGLDVTPIEEINLGYNDLNHLPLEFGRLKTLRSLWLDDNSFEEFPIAICQLVNLDSLRFSSNQLAVVPPTITELKGLTTLALDNNLFVDFPQPILSLTSLKHLWLRQNKMKIVPEELSTLVNLETLSLSSNQLIALPTLIPPAPLDQKSDNNNVDDAIEVANDDTTPYFLKLRKVYANGNTISDISDQWAQLPLLEHINLANNSLYAVPGPWNYAVVDAEKHIKKGIFTVIPSTGSPQLNKLEVNIFGNPVLN